MKIIHRVRCGKVSPKWIQDKLQSPNKNVGPSVLISEAGKVQSETLTFAHPSPLRLCGVQTNFVSGLVIYIWIYSFKLNEHENERKTNFMYDGMTNVDIYIEKLLCVSGNSLYVSYM